MTILVRPESYVVHHMGHLTLPFAPFEDEVEYPSLMI